MARQFSFRNVYSINPSHPYNYRKVAWWLPDRRQFGTGNWLDLVSGQSATFNSFSSGYGWNPFGQYTPGSVYFNNSANYLSTGFDIAKYSSAAMAVVLWVYVPSFTADAAFCGQWNDGAANNRCWSLAQGESSGQIRFDTTPSNTFFVAANKVECSAGTFTYGAWNEIIANCDGTFSVLYLNGSQVAITTLGSTGLSTGGPLLQVNGETFADAQTFSSFYLGELAVYSRAIMIPEITSYRFRRQQGFPGEINRYSAVSAFPIPSLTTPFTIFPPLISRPRFEPAYYE